MPVDGGPQTQGLHGRVVLVPVDAGHVDPVRTERPTASLRLEPAVRRVRGLQLGEQVGGEPLLDLVQERGGELLLLGDDQDAHVRVHADPVRRVVHGDRLRLRVARGDVHDQPVRVPLVPLAPFNGCRVAAFQNVNPLLLVRVCVVPQEFLPPRGEIQGVLVLLDAPRLRGRASGPHIVHLPGELFVVPPPLLIRAHRATHRTHCVLHQDAVRDRIHHTPLRLTDRHLTGHRHRAPPRCFMRRKANAQVHVSTTRRTATPGRMQTAMHAVGMGGHLWGRAVQTSPHATGAPPADPRTPPGPRRGASSSPGGVAPPAQGEPNAPTRALAPTRACALHERLHEAARTQRAALHSAGSLHHRVPPAPSMSLHYIESVGPQTCVLTCDDTPKNQSRLQRIRVSPQTERDVDGDSTPPHEGPRFSIPRVKCGRDQGPHPPPSPALLTRP